MKIKTATFVSIIIMSVIAALGVNFCSNGYQSISKFQLIVLSLFFVAIGLAIAKLISTRTGQTASIDILDRLDSLFNTSLKKGAFLFVCWLPWTVLLYPGVMNWDTFYQLTQFCNCDYPVWLVPYAPTGSIVDAQFSDHHPIFDTVIFGCFAELSNEITGNWNSGVFLYTLLQSAITAYAFGYAISYIVAINVPKKYANLALLFLAVVPIYPVYAATMVKDSLFSCLYIFYFIFILKLTQIEKTATLDTKFFLKFLFICLLLSLTKKTGVYLVAGTSLLLIFFFRSYWKQLACSALIPVLTTTVLVPCLIFPAANIIPGGKQEALSPLFQQTARFALIHKGEIPDSEAFAIDRVLNYENLAERYDAQNADPVKFMWNYNCTTEELADYMYVYFAEGIRDPLCYFEAWFATASGYLAPTSDGKIAIHTTTGSQEGELSDKIFLPENFEPIRYSLTLLYSEIKSIPGLDILFSLVLYCFWIPVASLLAFLKKNKELIPLSIPTMLSLACCIITPVIHARYALPLIYTAPLLVALAASPLKVSSHTHTKAINEHPITDQQDSSSIN